jgi:predicted transcriptional regulator
MSKEKKTNNEEFDRSICMSFFNDHRELVKRIERLHGLEMAYKVQCAIIDYGLDGIAPTEEELLQYIPEPVLNQIDNNQKRRSKSFKGEDLEVSRSIILLHRDRPEMSQNAIASELGVSKGKVNKTLQKYENGEYEGIIDFTDTSTSTITNTSTNTSNDRDQRDRLTVHSTELADAQTASTMPTADAVPIKIFRNRNYQLGRFTRVSIDNKTKNEHMYNATHSMSDNSSLEEVLDCAKINGVDKDYACSYIASNF